MLLRQHPAELVQYMDCSSNMQGEINLQILFAAMGAVNPQAHRPSSPRLGKTSAEKFESFSLVRDSFLEQKIYIRAQYPYLRVPFERAGPSPACTCLAHDACVLFLRVCQVITPGDPHTIPLHVPHSAHHCAWLHKHNESEQQ